MRKTAKMLIFFGFFKIFLKKTAFFLVIFKRLRFKDV